jgi:hypothetical protein
MKKVSFWTHLSVEQCKKMIDREINLSESKSKRLLGNIHRNKFKLHRKNKYSESFIKIRKYATYPVFYGELIEQEKRTLIQGRFRTEPLVAEIFVVVILIIFNALFIRNLIAFFTGSEIIFRRSSVGIPGMNLFFIYLRKVGEQDNKYVLQTIKRLLKGRDIKNNKQE